MLTKIVRNVNDNSNNIKLSKKKLVEYYYDELIDLISIHEDPIINAILDFYIKNKKKLLNFLNSEGIESL